jgi:hypothetical protein
VGAQEPASHGYVVAALDHPFDSAAVVLADGRVVRSTVTTTGDDAEDHRRVAGWTDSRRDRARHLSATTFCVRDRSRRARLTARFRGRAPAVGDDAHRRSGRRRRWSGWWCTSSPRRC